MVDFENLIQNLVENWLWDFGDGNISMEKIFFNIYDILGKYMVSFIVIGFGGLVIIIKEEYIEVVEFGIFG